MNFWPERASAAAFIGASLEILQQECRPAYRELCVRLAGRSVRLKIEDETVTLAFTRESARLEAAGEDEAGIRLTTGWDAVLDLVDGRLAFIDAVLTGRLDLCGEAGELAVFYTGLQTYLRGAVRSPSFRSLLDRLRLVHPAGARD